MSTSPSQAAERKHWWLTNRKIVDKYVTDARSLIATQDQSDITWALGLLEAALSLSPRAEAALELKARCLLFLRRFRDVADMLQDYIPSYRAASPDDDSGTSLSSASSSDSRERTKLLPSGDDDGQGGGGLSFRCFSVADLKRKVMAGISRSSDGEGQWRYLVLGQACCHLGMMEDAMVLLQTGRRLATAAFRRESVCWSDDSFGAAAPPQAAAAAAAAAASESDAISPLLAHIKLLLRRRAAAIAALDAGLPAEAVRHFTKILEGRRGTPLAFAAGCLVGRAAAYRASGRLSEAIADCNRALSLDSASIPALRGRADALEDVRALPDCLRDLEHLKLLYDAVLRDRKLPGPPWRPHYDVRYRDIPGCLRALSLRIQEIRLRAAAAAAGGGGGGVDYYALIGVRRGCSRSEVERAHLLLSLRHKPDRAAGFVDRVEFAGSHQDLDAVRDQARMSALILYRMLQKGYSSIMGAVMEDEAAERQRKRGAELAAAAAANSALQAAEEAKLERELGAVVTKECGLDSIVTPAGQGAAAGAMFKGVFCRELAAVGGFGRVIPVKYEGLSC